MKRAAALFLLFICAASMAVPPEGEPAHDASPIPVHYPDDFGKGPLDGKAISVRCYAPNEKPDSFRRLEALVFHEECGKTRKEIVSGPMPYFKIELAETSEGSVLVVVSDEQTDVVVRELLGSSVQVCSGDEGRYYFRLGCEGQHICMQDACGAPIPQGSIQISLTPRDGEVIHVGPWQTLDDGTVHLPEIMPNASEAIVSHPEMGIAVIPLNPKRSSLETPLIRRGSDAYKHALRGRVIDPQGQPVEGAIITPGGNPGYGLVTDREGRFAGHIGTGDSLLPPHTEQRYQVKAPCEMALPVILCTAGNDEETLIRLESGEFHRFLFEDDSGPIRDPARLMGMSVEKRDGGGALLARISGDEIVAGTILANGVYQAVMAGVIMRASSNKTGMPEFIHAAPITFPAMEVTEESPVELKFSLKESKGIVIAGQAMNSVTLEPLKGVFVCAAGVPDADLTEEDWRQFESLLDTPSPSDLVDAGVRDILPDDRLVRTGSDGRFEITLKPGQALRGVGLWAKGYLPYTFWPQHIRPDEKGVAHYALVPMFPAATVTFTVASSFGADQYRVKWRVENESISFWPLSLQYPLISLCADFGSRWRSPGEPEVLAVPAGVPLSLELISTKETITKVTVAGGNALRHGETTRLGTL